MLVNFFGDFFNRCFHCVISVQKEHPESGIRCTSACVRFRVTFTSLGDYFQTVRTLETAALGSYLRHLEQVLYGSCTHGIYSDDIALCVFMQDSRSWRQNGIKKIAVQWLYRALCAAVNPYTQIKLRFRTSPTQRKLRKGLHIGLICIGSHDSDSH